MAIAGAGIGFVSALLGIGGGMLMVPALLGILMLLDIPADHRMHVAAGTSLSVMIATSIGSTLSHARRHDVVWPIVYRTIGGIACGVVADALLSHRLSGHALSTVFAIVLVVVGGTMIFGFRSSEGRIRRDPGLVRGSIAGSIIGFKSGLLGVGGGALSVPWLTFAGLPQRLVSGTSSVFTLPAAIVGTISFMLMGPATPDWTLIGAVYWPALPIAGGASIAATRFGASLSGRVPGRILRIAFGVMVVLVAITMLAS